MLTARWTILENITEYIVELCFILDIDISIGDTFKELLFRRAEYVWYFFVPVFLAILPLFSVLLYLQV